MDNIPDGTLFTPENSIVAVAQENEKIVGMLSIVSIPHLEGIWVDPCCRGGRVGYMLEKTCCEKLCDLGAKGVAAFAPFALPDTIGPYLDRLGYTEFASVWKKEI